MKAIVERDPDALARLYGLYAASLYGLALRITGDRIEAEDVLQEIFLQLWNRPEQYKEARGSPFTWMMTLCRNRAIDKVRSRLVRAKGHHRASEENAVMSAAESAPDRENEFDAESRQKAVNRAMSALPEDQRRAIEMAYFEDLTQSEIAEKLGVPLGTVKTRIRLGMMKLRDHLKPLHVPGV